MAPKHPLESDGCRGLVIRPEFACKFFEKDSVGRLKTMELKGFNLRCVAPGGRFYIVACRQGQNKHGQSVVKVIGSVKFVANIVMQHSEVCRRFDEHLCDSQDYDKLSAKWKHCVGWKVTDPQAFPDPMFTEMVNQD